jgi:activator of HSP90 ATPase
MCKTIKHKVIFRAAPKEVYRLLTDPKSLRAITKEPASNALSVGGRFSLFDGRISGINVDLVPGIRIVQAWRDRRFPEGIFSMATFNLDPHGMGATALTLTHRGVPKTLIPAIETEWKRYFWDPIKERLSTSA